MQQVRNNTVRSAVRSFAEAWAHGGREKREGRRWQGKKKKKKRVREKKIAVAPPPFANAGNYFSRVPDTSRNLAARRRREKIEIPAILFAREPFSTSLIGPSRALCASDRCSKQSRRRDSEPFLRVRARSSG
ncbi:hypothetical protein PUN28_007837 [Cardiocondyla obscurior]|uniref:Uncharacterized protein n=1 Tax=Cardiocondyla obscurior TaxID=286306 RepID=A0AAW2G0M9_9HYME